MLEVSEGRLERSVRSRLKREVVRRRWTYEEVAQRAGLGTPRTAERFLEGATFGLETANALADCMRVEWEHASLLDGFPLYRLRDTGDTWWLRLDELADRVDRDPTSVQRRVDLAVSVGRLERDQVRRGVRREAILQPLQGWPLRGCTMLSARVALWVLITTQGERGEVARTTLIDEGFEMLRAAGIRR